LRDRYLPAISNVIRYILLDTVANQLRLPVFRLPSLTSGHTRVKRDRVIFEELVERVIRTRSEGAGFWPLLTADGPDEAIRSNVRVFLAGALEATSSYVGWAIANLARHPEARAKTHAEALASDMSPAGRERAAYLQMVLAETLRLNNALYFLPRIAMRDASVATAKGRLNIPAGTHIVLATYHANRCEAHWGVAKSGFPATDFVPERWAEGHLAKCGRSPKESIHFGFGHGPRVCIGKHFSEVEAFVCLTMFLRRFDFRAVRETCDADAGVSTRPRDGCEVELVLRG
jgi:cytochrome P450